eukprot:gnl/MRDRNA2_/MRDRNA2_165176_c0_seq1.p1 gnl/MRDRNA2_/MRDRNA2_165176_c0~~gnl/MRDRNA2_/MRDRNA2_165176_c0_seq1.p1  ORF type:complete len:146 (-),score=37.44 gnl/MRDRNA2_/MRDRNA2_165176_c0_seq1:301-738(-)
MLKFAKIIMLVSVLKAQGKDVAANSKATTDNSMAKLLDKLTEKLADRGLKSPHLKELDNTVLGKPARQESVPKTEAARPSPRLLLPTLPSKEAFTQAAQNAAIGGVAVLAGTAGVAETAMKLTAAAHVARTMFAKDNERIVGNPA